MIILNLNIASATEIKIGYITTLSGIGADIGRDIYDGFTLGIADQKDSVFGYDIKIVLRDDARAIQLAMQHRDEFIEDKKFDIVTGIIWSDLAIAVAPLIARKKILYMSSNAGPSALAGKYCHENYFNMSWQNDILHEAVGEFVRRQGYRTPYIIAPNYPAGRDGLNGFKRKFHKQPLKEVYVPVGETNYQDVLQDISVKKPDSLYFFLPGQMGILFLKQFSQMNIDVPMFGPAFSFDETILRKVGDVALGVMNASQWSPDFRNEANIEFVRKFKKSLGRVPSLFAAQGYDTARLLMASLGRIKPETYNLDLLRAELRKAEFASVRGKFTFGNNQHPIQDIYMRKVVEREGHLTNQTHSIASIKAQDVYHSACEISF